MSIHAITELGGAHGSAALEQSERLSELEPELGSPKAAAGTAGFGDLLGAIVTQANTADAMASKKVDALAAGISDDLHGTMIAVKEADISVKLVASIRNKMLDAFNDIWKTSV